MTAQSQMTAEAIVRLWFLYSRIHTFLVMMLMGELTLLLLLKMSQVLSNGGPLHLYNCIRHSTHNQNGCASRGEYLILFHMKM